MKREEAYEIVKTLPGYEPLLADEMANALIAGFELAVNRTCDWFYKEYDHHCGPMKFMTDNMVKRYKENIQK